MIRVCHLAKYYAPFRGGIETHVRSLARSQHDSGLEVTVACINHLDDHGQDVWCNRLARTSRDSSVDHGVKLEKFPKYATLARFDFCTGISRYLRHAHEKFDLLHLHVPNPTLCCALALTKCDLPLVVTYHSDIVRQRFIRKPFRLVERAVFSRVSRFIASTAAYAHSSPILQPLHNRLSIVPFGLDLRPYATPNAAAIQFRDQLLSQAAGMPIWLCVGRLVYYKGIEHAVRALPMCRGRLMIVGSGPLKPMLESLAHQLGVADRIDWYGALSEDQLTGAYHAATAFWFPSVLRSEAFGLVQIEAMASGCPVINTDIPGSGVSCVSVDGESGFTVPVSDPAALAAAANRIDADPQLRESLSRGAVQRAARDFSLQRMVKQTTDVYESVLARAVCREPVAEPGVVKVKGFAPLINGAVNMQLESPASECRI